MNIRVTGIIWEGVGDLVRSVTTAMQDHLRLAFRDLSFGAEISQLTIVVVSVSEDEDEQKKIYKGYNKVGTFRNLITREPIKFIGLAVAITPEALVKMDRLGFCDALCSSLLEKISNPDIRIPAAFDYEAFSRQFQSEIVRFRSTAR